jgi:O-antigen/teichoic acid export membrane protein
MSDAKPILDYQPATRRLRALADMKGLWSLGDQAILSLGNFLTTWLLLRTQSNWYGNYYVILTIIFFLNNLHMSMVTYPISITSAGITDSELRRRIRRAIGFTLLLGIPESLIIGVGTRITTGSWRLVPLAVAALVIWQLQETVRRALMARLEHRRAIAGDIVAYLVQAAAIWVVIHLGWITIGWAFGLIGASSLVAFFIQAAQLKLYLPSHDEPSHSIHQQARHHFSLGQWILLATSVSVLTIYSIPWMLRYMHGPTGVAMYSALLLVLNASNPLRDAMANLITPVVANTHAAARNAGRRGDRECLRAAIKHAIQGACILFPFFTFIAVIPSVPLHIFYKPGSPYLALGNPMRIFAAVYTLTYISSVVNSYLCGLGLSKVPFMAQLANAVATVLITLPLVAMWGLTGAAIGGLFSVGAQLCVSCYHVWKVWHKTSDELSSPVALHAQPV